MKKTYLVIVAFLMVVSSCKKDDFKYQTDFEKSKQAWDAYKQSVNNSYSYVTYYGSVFGFYAETKITVQNGKVIGRAYTLIARSQNSTTPQVRTSWTEDSTNLNTHNEGADSLTLDDIYAKAPQTWLAVDTKTNDVSFTTDTDGLIASCGYVPNGCQDDCFNGVYIKSIMAL